MCVNVRCGTSESRVDEIWKYCERDQEISFGGLALNSYRIVYFSKVNLTQESISAKVPYRKNAVLQLMT